MLKPTRILVLMVLILASVYKLEAQKITNDTSKIKRLDPAKAALYSAVCPGLGQIYNQKYWKAAAVYVGFASITGMFIHSQRQLNSYQKAVDVRFDSSAATIDTRYPSLNDGSVLGLRNFHRRNRDICILAYFGLYALNIIDANVDAHLQEFSINKDLSLRWGPRFDFNTANKPVTSLSFTLKF